jgi:hypothetical protein
MVRTRTACLVAVVALGLGAGACDSGKKDSKAGAVNNPDLALLPADSEVVLGLNFAQLQQSAMWKQFSPLFMSKAASGLAEFKTACGFDPMEAVKSISMGAKGAGGANPEGVVVIHGPDKAKVTGCLDKMKAEAAKGGADIQQDGDVFTVKAPNGETSAFTFLGTDTIVGSFGPQASKATVMTAAKGGSGLGTSATFVEMYSKINTKDSVWVLVNGNAPFMAKASSFGIKAKAIFGSVNVTDGLTVDLRIRMGSNDEVKNFVSLAKSQTDNPQVKAMFDKLDVSQDGPDAKFSVALSQQKLMTLASTMGSMFGGMLGGGMGGGGMGGGDMPESGDAP